MDVSIDEAGQHGGAANVEHRGVRRGEVGCDGGDPAVSHEDPDREARRCTCSVDETCIPEQERLCMSVCAWE